MHKAIGRILAALGVLALAVGIAQSSLVQSESTGSLPHRSPNAGTQTPPRQVLRDPWSESVCDTVDVIPAQRGDFCAKLKKREAVSLMPPPGINTEFKVTVPATIDYIGWNKEFLGQREVKGENDYVCLLKGTRSLSIRAIDQEGTIRVLIGKIPSQERAKCP